jgi:hypothetical protein
MPGIISDIAVKIRAITAPFTNGLEHAARKVRGFSDGIKNVFGGVTTVFSGAVGVVKMLGNAVGSVISLMVDLGKKFALVAAGAGALMTAIAIKSVKAASSLESLNSQFSVLLKSQEKANARMAELVKFAAETPFQIGDIAKANKVLQSLTGGLLATADGMRLVGDAAAFAARPIDEIAVQIGRLYSGIQSGTAVGEPVARLRELGVVSGDTGHQISELIKAGAKGNDVWKLAERDIKRFTGTMKAMSQTTEGLISTMKDNFNLVFAELGKDLLPVVKFAVTKLNDAFIDLKKTVSGMRGIIRGNIMNAFKNIAPVVLQTVNAISAMWQRLSEWLGSPDTNKWMKIFSDGLFDMMANVEFVARNFEQTWKLAMDGLIMATRVGWQKWNNFMVKATMKTMGTLLKLPAMLPDLMSALFDRKMTIKDMKQKLEAEFRGAIWGLSRFINPTKKEIDELRKRFEKLNKEREKFVGKRREQVDNQIKGLLLELEGFFDGPDSGKKFGENIADNIEQAVGKVKLEPKLALRGSQEAARISAMRSTSNQKIENNTKETAKATKRTADLIAQILQKQAGIAVDAVNVFSPSVAGGAVGKVGVR